MSYILDALKKSERERNASAPVNFNSKVDEKRESRINLKTLLIWTTIILGVNFTSAYILIGYKFSSSPNADTSENDSVDLNRTSKKETEINGLITRKQAELKEYDQNDYQEELIVPSFTSLPKDMRNELLPFNIDSHIYADEKNLRLIKIGRVTYFEGDYLRPNLKLERITNEGVILVMSKRMFSVKIKDVWDL